MKKRIIRFFMRLFAALPLGVHYANAHFVGWIARVVVRYRYAVVKTNIDNAFPELSEKERKGIVKAFYLHFGQIVCETIWFGGSKGKRLRRSHIVSIKNPEEIERLYNAAPGTIVFCSHLGNWELYGGIPFYNYTDKPMPVDFDNAGVVYRKLKNATWDEIFKENRKFCHPEFEHLVESSNIIRHILTHMDKKMFYFMNTDQWPYFSAPSYIMVDFMGQRTRTMSGGATVANKYSLAVTYLSMTRREGKKKYEMEFKTICDNASTMTVQQIMDRYYELLESDIRKDPGNYLWSHKRWKKC